MCFVIFVEVFAFMGDKDITEGLLSVCDNDLEKQYFCLKFYKYFIEVSQPLW